jgi:hypothetical protein
MTFKKQIEEAEAASATAAADKERERNARLADLETISDKLERHLISQNPSEVGLELKRDKARMSLKSRDYTIIIDAGFEEYTGMVVVGYPPKIAQGSRQKLSTLDLVNAYILRIVRDNPPA